MRVPRGKLASSIYWYERDPDLLEAEKQAMQASFPHFQLEKLEDGRLCWIGNLNPSGADGGVWTVQAIYDNNHPHNNSYGGSVCVYSIRPDLDEMYDEFGKLPHVLRDAYGHRYMYTVPNEEIHNGVNTVTSAAKSLGWAVRWIWVVEGWLKGDFGQEVFGHTFWGREVIITTNSTGQDDTAAQRWKEIAERMKNGQPVVINPGSGEITTPDDPGAGENAMRVPRLGPVPGPGYSPSHDDSAG
jgi:hypothetical protein